MANNSAPYHFFKHDEKKVIEELGKERLLSVLRRILLIRKFEERARFAYLSKGLIGGFFHDYIGQEAIQTAAVEAIGMNSYFATTYRCHALALLLGATPLEIMQELLGRKEGNARGRGGSMHLYTDRLLGGSGIVGGQIPLGTGAAFSLKYQGKKEHVSVTFMGDGAVAQGSFHESLNIASLWKLPAIYVIENNQWGMGTAVSRAIAAKPMAENLSVGYNISSYTLDGMDFFNCYAGFQAAKEEVIKTSKPVLIEVVGERFSGHSVSDPGKYRTAENLLECKKRDPYLTFPKKLLELGFLTEKELEKIDRDLHIQMEEILEKAENSPWPDPLTLGEDVFAPDTFKLVREER